MRKLEQGVSERINAICEHARRLVDGGDIKFAVTKYIEALNLIPNPKMDYKAATYIYTNVGEVYWRAKDYKNSGTAFSQASICPGGADNPVIVMRIGQCLLECGDKARAEEYLLKAYLLGDEEIFAQEDEKYIQIVRRRLSEEEPSHEDYSSDFADDFIIEPSQPEPEFVPESAETFDYDQPEPEPDEPDEEAPRSKRFTSRRKDKWDSDWEDEYEDEVEDDRIQASYADDFDDEDEDDDEYDEGLFTPIVNAFKSWFKK